jgi:hypothetical protein
MKENLPLIVFTLYIINWTIMIIDIVVDLTDRFIAFANEIILAILFLLFWMFFPMTSKK